MGEDLDSAYVARRRRANAERTVRKMVKKLGERVEGPGEIPPRVVKAALEDGSWCDAEIMSEYFGGILAASATTDRRSDRGTSWAALVSGLASYDVHMHYLVYDAFRRLYLGEDLQLGLGDVHRSMAIYLPTSGLVEGLGLTGGGPDEIALSLSALAREDLIGPEHRWGNRDFIEQELLGAHEGGAIVRPSSYGIELFLWAHGYGTDSRTVLLDPDRDFDTEEEFGSIVGACKAADIRREHLERKKREAESASS